MTPNQRDVFMYSWAQRRKRGRLGNLLLTAGIGAAGGVLFGLLMLMPGGISLNQSGAASPTFPDLLAGLATMGKLFGLAIPAFAFLAAVLGDRIWAANEHMYQGFLDQGASPPATKPTLKAGERGPLIAVYIAAGLIACFIIVVWILYG